MSSSGDDSAVLNETFSQVLHLFVWLVRRKRPETLADMDRVDLLILHDFIGRLVRP